MNNAWLVEEGTGERCSQSAQLWLWSTALTGSEAQAGWAKLWGVWGGQLWGTCGILLLVTQLSPGTPRSSLLFLVLVGGGAAQL